MKQFDNFSRRSYFERTGLGVIVPDKNHYLVFNQQFSAVIEGT